MSEEEKQAERTKIILEALQGTILGTKHKTEKAKEHLEILEYKLNELTYRLDQFMAGNIPCGAFHPMTRKKEEET